VKESLVLGTLEAELDARIAEAFQQLYQTFQLKFLVDGDHDMRLQVAHSAMGEHSWLISCLTPWDEKTLNGLYVMSDEERYMARVQAHEQAKKMRAEQLKKQEQTKQADKDG
jgi:hypothetical protein